MRTDIILNWMTHKPITINPETSLADARLILQRYNIRRLPVVDSNTKLIGIVTLGDVRKASASTTETLHVWEIEDLLISLTVKTFMTSNPTIIYDSDPIIEAAKIMLTHKIGGLPVLNRANKLVGIITESDIFRGVVQKWGEPELTMA